MSIIINANPISLLLASQALKEGKLVAIPTETVYGLAADATNPSAVEKIFIAKERPQQHPLIVHIADIDQLTDWAIDIPPSAYQLAKKFWPGPLTLILKKHPKVHPIITGNQETIGIRMPAHPVTLAILKQGHLAVAAPSANRHCQISPTTAQHVEEELGDKVDLIIDGGPCAVGVESTIINLTSTPYEILRPGMISQEAISAVLTEKIHTQKSTFSPRVSGSLDKHYSPKKTAMLLPENAILETSLQYKKVAVMAFLEKPKAWSGYWETMPTNAEAYAQKLYSTLRQLDHTDADIILIAKPPMDWLAIYDRLQRACAISHS